MPQVVRPGLSQFDPLRSAPVKWGDGRDPLWRHRLSEGETLYDPMLLDPVFDELGCETSILLKIVNQT